MFKTKWVWFSFLVISLALALVAQNAGSADDLQQTAQRQMDVLMADHQRGDQLVQVFDRKLDEMAANPNDGASPLQTPEYAELMRSWAEAESHRDALVSVYVESLSSDNPLGRATREAFDERLRGADGAFYQEAAGELHRTLERLQAFAGPPALPPTPPAATAPISPPSVAPGVAPSAPPSTWPAEVNGNFFPAGEWALTFDDGPSSAYTNAILDNLDRHGLKASFMWLANNAPHLTAIVARADADGMTLCDHSFTHPNLAQMGQAGLNHEIGDSMRALNAIYAHPIRMFRCPYGSCGGGPGSAVHKTIASLNMTSVLWNVDSLDWQDHNPQSVYARVKKQMAMQKRGIILFHDIHPQSVVASELVMRDFEAARKGPAGGLKAVTLQQALDDSAAR